MPKRKRRSSGSNKGSHQAAANKKPAMEPIVCNSEIELDERLKSGDYGNIVLGPEITSISVGTRQVKNTRDQDTLLKVLESNYEIKDLGFSK